MLIHITFPRRQLPKVLHSVRNITTAKADTRASK
jgi:hypothetical protein